MFFQKDFKIKTSKPGDEYITMQRLTEEGIKNVGPHVEVMAAVEGLGAHKAAVTKRLEDV